MIKTVIKYKKVENSLFRNANCQFFMGLCLYMYLSTLRKIGRILRKYLFISEDFDIKAKSCTANFIDITQEL